MKSCVVSVVATALMISTTVAASACNRGQWYEEVLALVDANPEWRKQVERKIAEYGPGRGGLYAAISLQTEGNRNLMNIWLWARCDLLRTDPRHWEVRSVQTRGSGARAVTSDVVQREGVILGFNHGANDLWYVASRD